MKTQLLRKASAILSLLGVASLFAGGFLSVTQVPAFAADAPVESPTPTFEGQVACEAPPNGWNRTVRIKGYGDGSHSKEWTFTVDEPEMDVTLEFIYFQDYDPTGCPFDCTLGYCQVDEIGTFTSPLGSFHVEDGQQGINQGKERLEGRLPQGTYKASFTAEGHSINIGLKVQMRSLPTATAAPTDIPPAPPATEVVEPPVATATDAPTAIPPTEGVLPPVATATDIPTEGVLPPVATEASTPTATAHVKPPTATHTPTLPPAGPQPSAPTRTPGAPATLPPPSQPAETGQPGQLIPITGADLQSGQLAAALLPGMFLKLGFALFGLALVAYGASRRGG